MAYEQKIKELGELVHELARNHELSHPAIDQMVKELAEEDVHQSILEKGILPEENENKCPNCYSSYDDANYCPNCGFAIQRYKEIHTRCPQCHDVILKNEQYCHTCGTKQEDVEENLEIDERALLDRPMYYDVKTGKRMER